MTPVTTTIETIHIRLAQPDEGPLVGRMVRLYGGPQWDWLDWSQVYPYWLIGEVRGVPRGTVMAAPGVPFGRMECLCVDPTLPHRQKALLVRQLSYAGIASCQQMGSQAVFSTINRLDEGWNHIAQARGWVPMDEGTLLVKRVI